MCDTCGVESSPRGAMVCAWCSDRDLGAVPRGEDFQEATRTITNATEYLIN